MSRAWQSAAGDGVDPRPDVRSPPRLGPFSHQLARMLACPLAPHAPRERWPSQLTSALPFTADPHRAQRLGSSASPALTRGPQTLPYLAQGIVPKETSSSMSKPPPPPLHLGGTAASPHSTGADGPPPPPSSSATPTTQSHHSASTPNGNANHPHPGSSASSSPSSAGTTQGAATTAPTAAQPAAPPAYPALHLTPLNGTFVPKQISLDHTTSGGGGGRVKIGRQINAKTVPNATNGYFDSKVLSRAHAEVWSEDGKVSPSKCSSRVLESPTMD